MRSSTIRCVVAVLAACSAGRASAPPAALAPTTPAAPGQVTPGGPTQPILAAAPPPSCEELAGDPVAWGVVVPQPELAPHALRLVALEIRARCEAEGWNHEARRCVGGARDRAAVDACVTRLDVETATALRTGLARVTTDLGTMKAELETEPPWNGCSSAAAAHYTDAWKLREPAKPDALSHKHLAKLERAASAAMQEACAKEQWSAADLACFRTYKAKSSHYDAFGPHPSAEWPEPQRFACLDEARAARWQYPPLEVLHVPWIHCGKPVAAAVAKHYSAPTIPMSALELAEAQAKLAFTLLAACDARTWTKAQLACLERGDAIHACVKLAPTDPLMGVLYDGRFDDGEGLPRP